MGILMNIQGYWDINFHKSFNIKEKWEGRILLEEDGWFEGIVNEPKGKYKGDKFVFGIYYPDKTIELFKFAPVKKSAQFVYHCNKTSHPYFGNIEAIDPVGGPFTVADGLIITNIVNYSITTRQLELEEKIKNYKDNSMDEIGRNFYMKFKSIRSSLAKYVLLKYNKNISTGDSKQLFNDFVPNYSLIKNEMANSVINNYSNNAKRLILNNSFEENKNTN